jgi:hypothetical protein
MGMNHTNSVVMYFSLLSTNSGKQLTVTFVMWSTCLLDIQFQVYLQIN